jgi:hypothetical protein
LIWSRKRRKVGWVIRKGREGGEVGKGRMGFKEVGDLDGMLPEIESGEVSREGRAVEEMDGGVVG